MVSEQQYVDNSKYNGLVLIANKQRELETVAHGNAIYIGRRETSRYVYCSARHLNRNLFPHRCPLTVFLNEPHVLGRRNTLPSCGERGARGEDGQEIGAEMNRERCFRGGGWSPVSMRLGRPMDAATGRTCKKAGRRRWPPGLRGDRFLSPLAHCQVRGAVGWCGRD